VHIRDETMKKYTREEIYTITSQMSNELFEKSKMDRFVTLDDMKKFIEDCNSQSWNYSDLYNYLMRGVE